LIGYNNNDITKNSQVSKNDNGINSNILISENKSQPEISDLFIPASEIESSNSELFSTGAKSLDHLLGGGLEPKTITQFYGPPGSGKTQLCFTFCCVLSSHFKCLYIDTEGTFRPERIIQIAEARKINISLQNIFVSKVFSTIELEKSIDNIDKLIQSDPAIKLVIIDSMTNLYKVEYCGPAKLSQRQQQLNKYMHKLRHIAQIKNVAVVITNQVYSDYSNSSYRKDISVGGYSISYPCTNIINLLKRDSYSMIAEIVKSPYYAYDITYLYIDKQGVSDDFESIKRTKK
jgi:DNA repair protein RadA